MTSNTDGAAQGEAWAYDRWEDVCDFWRTGQPGSLNGKQEVADYLNELERKAQMADVLAQALERLELAMPIVDGAKTAAFGRWHAIIRAALAQFHAATGEAKL